MSLSNFEENNLAKAWKNEAPAKAAGMFVQLHTGDPGEDCTANVAAEDTRKAIALSAIANGAVTNTGEIEWEGAAADETITHVSVWDAVEGGNPRIYGACAEPKDLTEGNDARFKPEDLTLTLA